MNPQNKPNSSPIAMFSSFWRNRQLIWQMTRREISGRYRGSLLGLAWSFLNPLVMLMVYTFVFSVIFQSRWGEDQIANRSDFAIVLFTGMIVYNFFAEIVNRSPSLIITNVNYVKKVVFPLEILPWVSIGSVLFHSIVSFGVLLILQLAVDFSLPATALLFPIVFMPLIFACMGIAWFLAALGVFVRDIGQITSVVTTIMMFLSAVFYPLSALPQQYQSLLRLNPLILIITECRNVLIFDNPPDWTALGFSWLVGLCMASGGFWWFQKMRKGFADVI
ncbi:MAG: ABC transporter permease [Anaerolineales bacterium]